MALRAPTSQVCFICATATLPAMLVSNSAFATDYMSAAAAQRLMFPGASEFVPRALALTPEQTRLIASKAGAPFSTAFWQLTAAMSGEQVLGYVVTDSVIGKFELIDYAVALAPDGEIKDIEILSYREAHGGEVRTKAWRNQFVGKTVNAPLAIGDDIANISGATLSCTHLTDGIRRIATYARVALAKS
jgi:Na+-translocating ferredoxin:NAD+ oxidoreductase RnfG subunit